MNRCPYCFNPLPANGICGCNYERSQNAHYEDALRPGSVVGAGYLIGGVLGKGGFGITYRGYDLNMDRIVAIKEFFPKDMVTRGSLVSRPGVRPNEVITLTTENHAIYRKSLDLFYREARALSRLDKLPNVVHAHHIFLENGTAYIVMEYVEGFSLKEEIQRRGKIPERELLPLLDPVLGAVEKVHAVGIIHRDIAPDNIMIENGQPVLVDFGAARLGESHEISLLIGKKGYSSPEQMSGEELDFRSDIYSLGATYYKALSGTNPQDAVARMRNDQVVPLHKLVPEVSQPVSDAVMKAMDVDPDKRFRNVAEFRKVLKGEFETEPVNPTGPYDPSPDTPLSPHKLNRWLIPLLIIAAAACVFLFRDKIFSGTTGNPDSNVNTQIMQVAVETAIAQTKAAEPTAANTPVPISTNTPVPTNTPEPTAVPLKVGDLITFGRYEQDNNKANGAEPIEWQVLAVEKDRALLISRYALDTKPYNEEWESVTWETCTLRAWLNGEFYETAFSPEEKGRIQQVTNENPDNPDYGTKGGSRTQDRIFLLSIEEVNKYFASDEARKCWATDYAKENGAYVADSYGTSWWWLRSPGNNVKNASYVNNDGSVGVNGSNVNNNLVVVRPAFWLNL